MSAITIAGDVSGSVTLDAPAVAGTTVLTLPATSGTVLTRHVSSPANSLVIDASGNVNIGTQGVNTRLAISGGTGTSTTRWDVSTTQVIETSTNPALNAYADRIFDSLSHRVNTSGTERMRIDSSGNVLVGTTSTSYAYAGDSFRWISGSTAMLSRATTGATNQIAFFNPNGNVGAINTSASATSYLTSSDYRLKENINPMVGALDVVAQLKPVTYKWKVDGSDGQGFIAHELQAVVPECVTGEKDAVDEEGKPIYQGIDTSFLVATLTAAIQELNAKVEAQAEQIKALQGAA
jgi:hypothetical protein